MAKVVSLSPNSAGRRHTIHVPLVERTEPLEPPKALTPAQRKVWDRYIEPAKWLQDGDAPLAYAWTVIFANFLDDSDSVSAAQLSQMRLMAGDLGLRPADRQRLSRSKEAKDPASEFFG